MTALLVTLTVIEIVVVLAVVAVYLHLIGKSLERTSVHLGKVAAGVRAIDSQTAPVGPAITGINQRLSAIAAALDRVAGRVDQASGTSPRG